MPKVLLAPDAHSSWKWSCGHKDTWMSLQEPASLLQADAGLKLISSNKCKLILSG